MTSRQRFETARNAGTSMHRHSEVRADRCPQALEMRARESKRGFDTALTERLQGGLTKRAGRRKQRELQRRRARVSRRSDPNHGDLCHALSISAAAFIAECEREIQLTPAKLFQKD